MRRSRRPDSVTETEREKRKYPKQSMRSMSYSARFLGFKVMGVTRHSCESLGGSYEGTRVATSPFGYFREVKARKGEDTNLNRGCPSSVAFQFAAGVMSAVVSETEVSRGADKDNNRVL